MTNCNHLKAAICSVFLQLLQSTMTTTVLPPGIYHIVVDKPGGVDSQRLTRHEANGVTILPPSAQHDPEQEVICRFLMSSMVCRSPALLVGNHPSRDGKHHHRTPLPHHTNLLPYLQRRSRETQGRRPDRVPSF